MGAHLTEIVMEAADPTAAAKFWSAALGWEVRTHEPGHVPWISASGEPSADDLKLVFVQGPTDHPHRNRLYVNPTGVDVDTELGRLQSLGATRLASSTPWMTLSEPGGTELIVLPERIG